MFIYLLLFIVVAYMSATYLSVGQILASGAVGFVCGILGRWSMIRAFLKNLQRLGSLVRISRNHVRKCGGSIHFLSDREEACQLIEEFAKVAEDMNLDGEKG